MWFSIGRVPRLMERVNQCVMVLPLITSVEDSRLMVVPRPGNDCVTKITQQSDVTVNLFLSDITWGVGTLVSTYTDGEKERCYNGHKLNGSTFKTGMQILLHRASYLVETLQGNLWGGRVTTRLSATFFLVCWYRPHLDTGQSTLFLGLSKLFVSTKEVFCLIQSSMQVAGI